MARLRESSTTEQLRLSAEEIQQQFYEVKGEEDWELYEKKDRRHLLQKVAVALCGPPSQEGNLLPSFEDSGTGGREGLQGYSARDEQNCMKVFKKICEQANYSYNGENVLISILRIVLVTPKPVGLFKKTPPNHWLNLHVKKGDDVSIFVFHLFCARRCIPTKSDIKSCRCYIDHDARVYKTWQAYLEDNLLPKGIMVVPENGEYRGSLSVQEVQSEEDLDNSFQALKVKLTVLTSPAMGLGATILNVTDATSIAANLGALGAMIGAAFATPVVAPILLGGAVVTGVATGIYAIVRSSMRLADKGKHEQNIGLDSADARNDWINILVSTLGISFSAAAKLVAWAAMSGTNIRVLMNALTFLRYSSIASGLVGVVNNLGDMIYNYAKFKETPSTLDIFQFTTSCLFLGIGVMSNATAQEIVQDAQASTINEARDALSSNARRKAFDKVTAENRRTLGTINGNAETIKALNVITDKDDFFAKIARMNKDMNRNKVRISITSDGNTLINTKHEVSVNKLYGMGKGGRNKLFSNLGPADTSTKNAPTRIYASTCSAANPLMGKNISIEIRTEDIAAISQFLLSLCKADQDFVAEVLSHFSAELHNAFLLICIEIVSKATLGHRSARSVVFFVYNQIKSKISECDYENDTAFVLVLKSWIKNGKVDKEIILMLIKKFKDILKSEDNGAFYNDPDKYDYIEEFRKMNKNYKTLRSGEVISIGPHKIVVKGSTIECLEEWLDCNQENADILVEFIFKVIEFLSRKEIFSLNLINPDEDVIMRVAYFLFNEVAVNVLLLELQEVGIVPQKAINFKRDLLDWGRQQTLRDYKTCETCTGLLYKIR